MTRMRPLAAVAVALVLPAAAACTSNTTSNAGTAGEDGTLTVTSTDDSCDVSADAAPSGTLVFNIANEGNKVTEFYLYAEDGLRIIGEMENIGPGLSRDLVLTAEPGNYITACKPGMVGKGIREGFTITDSGENVSASVADEKLLDTANDQYSDYVADQASQLLTKTERFVELYKGGSDDEARASYADARVHWERIEPVAESFGDLDPKMDLREADLEEDQEWTGWHRIEKDLWPPNSGYQALTTGQRATYADQLLADTEDLVDRTREMTFTVDQIGNGAKSLLDEVATGKVTGEEEIWSHTDLWDFQANVDGARVAFEGLRPLLQKKDPELATRIESRFVALQKLLDEQRDGNGFVLYTELSTAEVKELSDAVNALSEPLSELTAAVTL